MVSSTSGGLSYEAQPDLGLRFVVVRAVVHSEAQQALVLNLGEKKVAQLPPVALGLRAPKRSVTTQLFACSAGGIQLPVTAFRSGRP